ncbi:MAG: FG-GAP-like repeat-containing protein [Cyclobacteriaceae bacterium]
MKKQIHLILKATFFTGALLGLAQVALTQIPPSVTSANAFIDWADYDQDGDQDVLFSYVLQSDPTNGFTQILINNSGNFTLTANVLTTSFARVKWGDFDNDGDLDFAQIGASAGIYRNEGNNVFTRLSDVIANYRESIEWGDLDNDGDLDLLVGGTTTGNWYDVGHARLYENDNTAFIEIVDFPGAALEFFTFNDVHWVDYDNDGDLDVSISSGFNSTPNQLPGTTLLTNVDGEFFDSGLRPAGWNASWGDLDQDGDYDLGCGRNQSSANQSIVFTNGGGSFANSISVNLGSLAHHGVCEFGDWDNDGDLDLAVAGGLDSTPAGGRILVNNATSLSIGTALTQFKAPSDGAFADVDNDGDLDLLISGRNGFSPSETFQTVLHLNPVGTTNNAPSIPTGLSVSFSAGGCNATGTSTTFSWNAATDNETSSSGLTYNLRIGTTPGGNQVMSGTNSLMPSMGNVQNHTSWTLYGLNPGVTYYWSVEAVDNSFAHSGFAAEAVYTPPTSATLFSDAGITLPGIGVGSLEWGDYDGDGDLDVLAGGNQNSTTGAINIYRNDGSTFALITTGFPSLINSTARFVDFDNDNDLDVALMGMSASGIPVFQIFSNTAGVFTNVPNLNIPGVHRGSMDWGDFDNNGFPDLAMMGLDVNSQPITKVFENYLGAFNENPAIVLPGIYDGDIAWHGFRLGYVELIISGKDANGNGLTHYYINNDGEFTLVNSSVTDIPQLSNSSIAANKVSPPNFYEYMIMGNGASASNSQMYHYVFDDETERLPGLSNGDVAWIDHDSDGDTDAVITGVDPATGLITTLLYENNNEVFSRVCNGFPTEGNSQSRIAVGDYDNDGDLDVVFTSFDQAGQSYGKVFMNNSQQPNTPPTMPANVQLSVNCNTISVQWDDATDAETPSQALSYNLSVGITPGGNDLLSGSALSNGMGLLAQPGNNGISNYFSTNVPNGKYYFAIQAVDNGFAKSSFYVDSITVQVVSDSIFRKTNLTFGTHSPFSPGWAVDLDADGSLEVITQDTYGTQAWQITGSSTTSRMLMTNDTTTREDFLSRYAVEDLDKDGDLDMAYTYRVPQEIPGVSTTGGLLFHLNTGNGFFSGLQDIPLDSSDSGGRHEIRGLIDFNNDGYLDILTLRDSFPSDHNDIFAHRKKSSVGYDTLVLQSGTGVFLHTSSVDFNNDGYKDQVYSRGGVYVSDLRVATFYLNDGQGRLNPFYSFGDTLRHNFFNHYLDFDSDGDIDLLTTATTSIAPDHSTLTRKLEIFVNDNGIGFNTPIELIPEIRVLYGLYPGDLDNDGDMDFILTGTYELTFGLPPKILFFENKGNLTFESREICTDLRYPGRITLLDFDNDNDLDLIVPDYMGGSPVRSYYFENRTAAVNTPPTAPAGLSSTYSMADSTLTFSWQAATDAQTLSAGLTYNLRVGKSPGALNVVHPKSISQPGLPLDGKRLVVEQGNTFQSKVWTLHGVIPGQDYYWSVQAIDNSYVGSVFAREQVAASNRSNGAGSLSGVMGSGSSGSAGGRLISGRKMDVDNPIADVLMALVEITSGDTLLLDRTDSKGLFDFTGVPQGSYRLHVRYDELPMDPENPVLNFSAGSQSIEVTVLVNNGKLTVATDGRITATEEEILSRQVQISPNPTTDQVNINVPGPASVSLISLTGQVLDQLSVSGAGNALLNTRSYPPGLYIIRVLINGTRLNYKLVKQ